MKARKLISINKNGVFSHVLVEKRWNYFDNDYDYFLVRFFIDELGNVERYEEKIPKEEGKRLMGEEVVG